ncbi:MAG TPA: hypothetical protein VNH53_09970 [Sphingomicrobium sp.]|nr:hypothetical protein [Sphingomicrobium sp.]
MKYFAAAILVVAAQPALAQIKPGFGAAVVMDFGDKPRVEDATLVNGVVRVNRDSNTSIRPMFDVHAPLWDLGKDVKAGPFLGAQFSKEQLIDSLGAGMMVNVPTGAAGTKLNFGLGLVLDPNVRTLGNGIVEDQPLPAGETEIRYRNTGKFGLLFMTSIGL